MFITIIKKEIGFFLTAKANEVQCVCIMFHEIETSSLLEQGGGVLDKGIFFTLFSILKYNRVINSHAYFLSGFEVQVGSVS